MAVSKRCGFLAAAAIAAAVSVLAPACTPRDTVPPSPDTTTVQTVENLALECELELQRLAELIEARESSPTFSLAALLEAKELRRSALELFVGAEYGLALELIGEAVAILGEGS